MRLIRVKYKVLEPVLDMHEAKDSQILVLTCYPERFSRIGGSHRLDMAELLRTDD